MTNGTQEANCLYVPLRVYGWPEVLIEVLPLGQGVRVAGRELLRQPASSGFLPVYDSLESLRADYPDCPHLTLEALPGQSISSRGEVVIRLSGKVAVSVEAARAESNS